jgi:hypothetical protein
MQMTVVPLSEAARLLNVPMTSLNYYHRRGLIPIVAQVGPCKLTTIDAVRKVLVEQGYTPNKQPRTYNTRPDKQA